MSYSPSSDFQDAAAYLSKSTSLSSVSNTIKLELYGLFKFLGVSATPQGSRPSIFDMTGRAKWDAWNAAGKTYQSRPADAEKRYLDIARELGWVQGAVIQTSSKDNEQNQNDSDDIWDVDSNLSDSRRGGGGGMGAAVSAMARSPEDEVDVNTLHGLAISNNAQMLSDFLETHVDVDINQRDEFGYTPLHLACDRGSTATAEILLKHRADPSIQDPDNFTAAELASIAGHSDIENLFKEMG